SAQALQCGTPGHGSGSRRRHTPGSTRSPRPSSRFFLASDTRRRLDSTTSQRPRGEDVPEPKASDASTKVKEAAASVQKAAAPRKRITGDKAEAVARRYFAAIDARDLDAAVALWAPGGRENVRGRIDTEAPEGVRAFIGELIDGMPDLTMEVLETTTEGDRCAVHWRL